MQIAILCVIGAIYSISAWIYFSYNEIKCLNRKPFEIVKIITEHKKRTIYVSVMALCMILFAVSLPLIYKSNLLSHNIKMMTLIATLFTVALVDFKKQIIPNKVILVALVLRVILYIYEFITITSNFWTIIKGDIISCLIVVIFFIIGVLIMKNGLGMGDIKLMLIMCLYQGFYGVISSIFCSLLVAFIISIVLLIAKKKSRKDAIAFAPSILIGTIASIFMTGM